ncbi:MAG: 50S ribosomal protein L23 [Nanoarchaeota archaeon]|nr:50S ribosomal protein L23 [Nanoarchaeota archaeon]
MSFQIKPVVTEKAVMMIESQNVLTFRARKEATKEEIKKEIEELFNVKVEKIRTIVRDNRKHAYVKLKKGFAAIDVATKLGVM